jgi:hypothetical protein
MGTPMATSLRCAGCGYCRAPGLQCGAALPHYEPTLDCARDELVAWGVEHGLEPGDVSWLLSWAGRRYAQRLGIIEEVLRSLVAADAPTIDGAMDRLLDLGAIARTAWNRLGLPMLVNGRPPT